MNRFAAPSSDVELLRPSFHLGLPGVSAAAVAVGYLAVALPRDPGFLALIASGSVLDLFFSLHSFTNLLILVSVLLLLARLPSSILLFAGALTAGLVGALGPHVSVAWPAVCVALVGLVTSLIVFVGPRVREYRARGA
jgi:hypothetical protein